MRGSGTSRHSCYINAHTCINIRRQYSNPYYTVERVVVASDFVICRLDECTVICSRVTLVTRVVVVPSDVAICCLDERTVCRTCEEASRFKYRSKAEVAISESIEGPRRVEVPERRGANSRAVVQYRMHDRHETTNKSIGDRNDQ